MRCNIQRPSVKRNACDRNQYPLLLLDTVGLVWHPLLRKYWSSVILIYGSPFFFASLKCWPSPLGAHDVMLFLLVRWGRVHWKINYHIPEQLPSLCRCEVKSISSYQGVMDLRLKEVCEEGCNAHWITRKGFSLSSVQHGAATISPQSFSLRGQNWILTVDHVPKANTYSVLMIKIWF